MIPTAPFGRTGHLSTRTIFGAAALWAAQDEDAAPLLETLLRYGINHIDTAASYGRSERRVGTWMRQHRDRFFLATKTNERTYDGAKAQFEHSLQRLGVPSVDLLQLHNLVDPGEWETAMAPGGALAWAVEARDRGLTRFIGVTGHGVTVAQMHLRSLEHFDFDSVLLPYNWTMMQNAQYASDFDELARVCAERNVALQTIKSLTVGPWGEQERTHITWYEPFTRQDDIDLAVRYVLGRPGLFLNTAGDPALLPLVLDAASRVAGMPPPLDDGMRALAERRAMAPLFT
jgi:aryl-alcohol dehydrogenase-like predicted oxidoreductase